MAQSELVLIQGDFGSAPEPYHLPIRNSYNLVIGEIPGAVMKGDGKLLGVDTFNRGPWQPEVGSNDDALTVLRTATALRRGPGKDFLVYGRMLSPARMEGIRTIRWQHGGYDNQVPVVFHAAWQSPAGRFGLALANWTGETREVRIRDPRLGGKAVQFLSAGTLEERKLAAEDGAVTVILSPLASAVVSQEASNQA